MPELWIATASSAVFATTAVLVALAAFLRCRGTTFVGPSLWAVAALVAASGVEAGIGASMVTPSSRVALRFVAAVGMFLPSISLLGAKRPQDRAWHLIVASLWVVLVLPAAEAYFIRPGIDLQIHDARGWFLWILILTGWANHLFTRFGMAVTLVGAAQICLLLPHLPLCGFANRSQPFVAAGLLALATLLVIVSNRRAAVSRGLDRTWMDFRNIYGAVWGLRVAERINDIAEGNRWPVRLTWNGFDWPDGAVVAEQRDGLTRQFRSLLRRFVSKEWIDDRLEPPPD